jgi:hypothetical protein
LQNKLVGSPDLGGGYQGYGLAFDAAGDVLIDGAPDDNANIGCVHAFRATPNGNWLQFNGKYIGSGATNAASQCAPLCVSSDGSVVAVEGSGELPDGAIWVWQ